MRLALAFAILGAAAAQRPDECPAAPEGSTYASDPPCYFPTNFLEVPVKAVKQDTHDTYIITFHLPKGVGLNLPVSSAIVMSAPGKDGTEIARPYNPISPHDRLGSFDLLVKGYEEGQD